jgi:hypothetical protein
MLICQPLILQGDERGAILFGRTVLCLQRRTGCARAQRNRRKDRKHREIIHVTDPISLIPCRSHVVLLSGSARVPRAGLGVTPRRTLFCFVPILRVEAVSVTFDP